jgi:hypothetical protein
MHTYIHMYIYIHTYTKIYTYIYIYCLYIFIKLRISEVQENLGNWSWFCHRSCQARGALHPFSPSQTSTTSWQGAENGRIKPGCWASIITRVDSAHKGLEHELTKRQWLVPWPCGYKVLADDHHLSRCCPQRVLLTHLTLCCTNQSTCRTDSFMMREKEVALSSFSGFVQSESSHAFLWGATPNVNSSRFRGCLWTHGA